MLFIYCRLVLKLPFVHYRIRGVDTTNGVDFGGGHLRAKTSLQSA